MTGKEKKELTGSNSQTRVEELGKEIKIAGRRVWLAGLGAVHSVDESGRGLFSDLVARGRRLERRERPALEERFHKAGDRVAAFRDRLEHDVEERLSSTLQRFGVPDRGEVHDLIDRIEKLTRKVEGLTPRAKA